MGWLARLFHRRALERELDTELRFHFDEHVRELMAQGRSASQARREARRALGGIEQVKERARDVRGTRWIEDWWQDTRFTLRGLRHEPGFTTVAVITLGLGIGAATAIFSAVYPVLFEPLAYPHPDRLVSISDRAGDGAPVPVTFGTYLELKRRARSFESLSVYRPWRVVLTGEHEPERVQGQLVSAGYFRTLGVTPARGPGFDPDNDRAGGPRTVILSDGLWRRRFAGDVDLVGRTLSLEGEPVTVVGVLPPGFDNVSSPGAEIWSLLRYDASLPSFEGREWGHHLGMIGRIRAGVELDAARHDLELIAASPLPEATRPAWASLERGLEVRPLREAATAAARPVLLALLGAAVLLLAIACVNVTNLVLARGARRQGELAMRAALGAGSGRLLRQLLTEGLVLAALGGALGLVAAYFGVGGLVALSPPGLPRASAIRLDVAAFAFALGITTLIGTAAGLAPAVAGSRSALRAGGRSSGGRRGAGTHIGTRRVLVAAEVALALVLLVGAGLMLRTLQHLFAIGTGFDGDGVVVLQVEVAGPQFAGDPAIHRFFASALAAAERVPGVAAAGWTTQLPLSGGSDVYGVTLAEKPDEPVGGAYRYAATPGYFASLRIPLLRGRLLQASDDDTSPPVAVVSEALASRLSPGDAILGRHIHLGRTDLPPFTVVGVVGNVKQASLGAEQADAVYVTPEQWAFADDTRWLAIRADHDPLGLVPTLRQAIWSVDDQQPILRVQSMDSLVATSEAQRRFALIVLEAFAFLALVLAAVGLYGVLAGSVAERRHEIGVRSALGATRQRIVALVVVQGMRLAGVGVFVGLLVAAAGSQALTSLLFGVSRLDPPTYLGVAVLLGVVAALACWVPAARAARVDPARTLRVE